MSDNSSDNCSDNNSDNNSDSKTQASSDLCKNGILNGKACCAKSCGRCGGEGCSNLPGGKEKCCSQAIKEQNELCDDEYAVACLVKPL